MVAIPLRGYVVCNGDGDGQKAQEQVVAIPLRGYVVCNVREAVRRHTPNDVSRNPLTGLCGLQLLLFPESEAPGFNSSQSPYGAMWFATGEGGLALRELPLRVAIPLQG